jgi:hypothetical protein
MWNIIRDQGLPANAIRWFHKCIELLEYLEITMEKDEPVAYPNTSDETG